LPPPQKGGGGRGSCMEEKEKEGKEHLHFAKEWQPK